MPCHTRQVKVRPTASALLLASASFIAGSAHANTLLNETLKLTAPDAQEADQFGVSVAISGNIAIVGANGDDDRGPESGSAYVYNVTTGSQIAKLTALDGAASDIFGKNVGIDGNIAIIGSIRDDDAGSESGSAYLFDVTTGGQIAKLTALDAAAEDNFGESVAISGNVAIVGAPLDDDAGYNSGSAYLFDVTTGGQIAKLTALDAAAEDFFGASVAIDSNIAIIGALLDDDAGKDSGSVYVFDVNTGQQINKLTALDGAAGDVFGNSVAISGNIAIVGAVLANNATGSAYLFDVTTGNQIAKLNASDTALGDRFGHSVAISGNLAIVGANNDADAGGSSGSAYLFDVTTGQQIAKLNASDASIADQFGVSVAINGGTAIIGAFLDDDAGVASGSAYLFTIPEPASAAALAPAALALMAGRRRG